MEILFATKEQCEIADLLWACESNEEALQVVRTYGKPAEVVYNMMVAAAFDDVTDVTQAQSILEKF